MLPTPVGRKTCALLNGTHGSTAKQISVQQVQHHKLESPPPPPPSPMCYFDAKNVPPPPPFPLPLLPVTSQAKAALEKGDIKGAAAGVMENLGGGAGK